jgi:hypothetical protein
MQMKLGDILSGRAVRRREPQYETVIEVLSALWIDDPAAVRYAWGREAPDERR